MYLQEEFMDYNQRIIIFSINYISRYIYRENTDLMECVPTVLVGKPRHVSTNMNALALVCLSIR